MSYVKTKRVEAFRFTEENWRERATWPAWVGSGASAPVDLQRSLLVQTGKATGKATLRLKPGDWLIMTASGKLKVMSDEAFQAEYSLDDVGLRNVCLSLRARAEHAEAREKGAEAELEASRRDAALLHLEACEANFEAVAAADIARAERDEWKARTEQATDANLNAINAIKCVEGERDVWKARAEKAEAACKAVVALVNRATAETKPREFDGAEHA